MIVGPGAAGAWLYSQDGAKVPVVVVVHEVPAGQVVHRSDLSTVAVAGGVTAIAGRNLESVAGQRAVVSLLPHMLLMRSMLTSDPGLGSGQAQVGVKVVSGQIPADGLVAGDTVRVLQLPGTGSSSTASAPGAAQVLVSAALVTAVQADPAQAGGTLLTVTVPAADAGAVATASGAGQVALVRVGVAS